MKALESYKEPGLKIKKGEKKGGEWKQINEGGEGEGGGKG